jgi:hypothetical protein
MISAIHFLSGKSRPCSVGGDRGWSLTCVCIIVHMFYSLEICDVTVTGGGVVTPPSPGSLHKIYH